MGVNLHGYQEYCVNFILDHPHCNLWLEPGLGKTVVTLTALADFNFLGEGKVLIIAPLEVSRNVWPNEIKKWGFNLTYSLVLGSAVARRKALSQEVDLYIINVENVPWLAREYPDWPFDTVVIDEASKFKAHNTMRFKALKRIKPKRFIALTGTPASQNLMDIWSQMFLLDQGERLEQYIGRYREKYFIPDKRNQHIVYSWKLQEGAEDKIYNRISDVTVSMKTSDYLKLPERVDNVVKCRLYDSTMQQYKQFQRDQVLEIGDAEITAVNAGVLCNKLMQFANGAVYQEDGISYTEVHQYKIDALKNIIDENQGKPVLVFYQYKHDVERILEAIPEAELLNPVMFMAGLQKIALAHPASAGHGLNLQEYCHTVIWFSLTWSLEQYLQANARVDRQGQTRPVVVHHLIAEGTIDERCMKALQSKQEGQDALIEAVKAVVLGSQKAVL